MMALGIVVIAAFVGAGGLGQTVLDGLQAGLDGVGEALNGGIAIVIMAIVLDRVSNAWSHRDRRHVEAGADRRTHPAAWVSSPSAPSSITDPGGRDRA